MPHEINRHIIESLDTRLEQNEEAEVTKLSDHRSLEVNRNVIKSGTLNPHFSSSIRLGTSTMVLGSVELTDAKSQIITADVGLEVKVQISKDTSGMVRRDVMEDKQGQVTGFITDKIRNCLNQNLRGRGKDDVDMSEDQFKPLQVNLSLNVIQDDKNEGNMFCALISVANDLLMQLS